MNPLLIRRRGMMQVQGDGIVLPPGYTKLKYLQGQTKHALINTHYLPNNNTRVILYAKKLSFKQYSPFLGTYQSESHNTTRIIQATSYDDIISNVNVKAGGGSLHTQVNTLEMHRYYIGRNYIYIDGALAGSNTIVNGTSSNSYMKINSTTGLLDGQADDPTTVFGQIQFLLGTVIERHFVPCINPSNICGFYEIMTDTFYGSDFTQYPFQPY